MFYLNSTLSFVIPPVLVFQLEVYSKVNRLLPGLTAQQKGTAARWYSNKTSLPLTVLAVLCFHYSSRCLAFVHEYHCLYIQNKKIF